MQIYRCTPPTLQKFTYRKGSALLAVVLVLSVISSFMAVSVAKISQASQNSIGSSKVALQAQQYAASKAELVKAEKYSDLTAQTKSIISNSNTFYDEVIIGDETDYPNNDKIKQKDVTINVYSNTETLPRASLKFTRYSVSNGTSVPQGTILPWYGKLDEIPDGFYLCDGKNGTPDLRNRFIVGAGDAYKLTDIGGENEVTLKAPQVGSHYHRWGYHNGNNGGYFLTSADSFVKAPLESWVRAGKWNGSNGGGYNGWDGGSGTNFGRGQNLVTSNAVSTEAQKPHENRPPYYALYYIMKV